jgi:hypothetical protein
MANGAEEVRFVAREADALGEGPWVIFNSPPPIETMFVTPVTAVFALPNDALLARARERGLRVAVYGERADAGDAPWAADPAVRWLSPDPRVAAERRLATMLRGLGNGRIQVYNAATVPALRRYLERNLDGDVWPYLPVRNAQLTRALARGGRLVVLDNGMPAALRDYVAQAFPEALFVTVAEQAAGASPAD